MDEVGNAVVLDKKEGRPNKESVPSGKKMEQSKGTICIH